MTKRTKTLFSVRFVAARALYVCDCELLNGQEKAEQTVAVLVDVLNVDVALAGALAFLGMLVHV